MRIGFDGKRIVLNNTGLGNYSRSLLEGLSTFYSENTYLIFSPKLKENPRLKYLQKQKNVVFLSPKNYFLKKLPSLWRSKFILSDLQKEKVSLFHGLSHEIPLGIHKTTIASIVSIHDLIPLVYPQFYPALDRFIYNKKAGYACKKADRIVATSECTKRDIVRFFHVDPSKIEVVYQDCHPNFKKMNSAEKIRAAQQKYGLPSSYILSVGSIEERKNLLLTVKALRKTDPEIQLVAIGRKTTYYQQVEDYCKKYNLLYRVHFIENVEFEDLPMLYQGASLFIYPSLYEGFGIPIIEALHSNIPVIACKGSCLEEAGGPHSVYVDPFDEHQLAKEMNDLLPPSSRRELMIKKGKEYVSSFDNEKLTQHIHHLYIKTIEIKIQKTRIV